MRCRHRASTFPAFFSPFFQDTVGEWRNGWFSACSPLSQRGVRGDFPGRGADVRNPPQPPFSKGGGKKGGVIMAMLCALLLTGPLHAEPDTLSRIRFEPRPGALVDADLVLRDRSGERLRLGDLLDGPPLILALVWYRCPNLCGLLLDALARDLAATGLTAGQDYRVVAVSIDPRETPEHARQKAALLGEQRSLAGWSFLTARDTVSRQLADTVGIGYVYDAASDQYGHPAAVSFISPAGRVSGYLSGVAFPAPELMDTIDTARGDGILDTARQFLMRCFRYDPVTGQYTLRIVWLLRAAGVLTLLGLGGGLTWLALRERREQAP